MNFLAYNIYILIFTNLFFTLNIMSMVALSEYNVTLFDCFCSINKQTFIFNESKKKTSYFTLFWSLSVH